MKRTNKVIEKYFVRQIVACFLVSCLLFNTSVVLALQETKLTGSSGLLPGTIWGPDTTLNTDHGAILDWSNFNTLSTESVTFNQYISGVLNSNSAVLNRISSGSVPTMFNGALSANGRVFIVNPAGVLFGSNAQVNVAQLVASAHPLINWQDFADGKLESLEFGGGNGIVTNEGEIIADSLVALIGKKVLNTGTISAPGGLVVMAAGDKILLGEPGSKIIIEMTSVQNPQDDEGHVINSETGEITASGGQIILAAGDVYSIPIHPQLQVGTIENRDYDYKIPADRAVIDLQPVRVETGTGSIEQLGTIQADGIDGSVILTAGDDIVLAEGSLTKSVGGEVITYAYDFGGKEATNYFNAGATIQIGDGFAAINGNHILFAGTVDALPEATIQVDPVTLTIADTLDPDTGPELDTLYEEQHIEFYSKAGVNLDLAADDMITVEYMANSNPIGEITGGSGDIYFRNVFDYGGIYFEQQDEAGHTGPRSTIHTTAYYVSDTDYRNGGNIYMDAGSGGIIAGDLLADILAKDKYSQPGDIVLRTSNGGDITVDTMQAIGAVETQVSAISDGDLTVNGDAKSISQQTDNEEQSVFKALLCLIAEGDVQLNGESYKVETKGKGSLTADIRISAGKNVYIATDPVTGLATGDAQIRATSRVAEGRTATQSTAYIVIHAGRNLPGSGVIKINGEEYVSGSKFAGKDDIMGKVWPGALSKDTHDTTPTTTDGTKSVWLEKDEDDPVNFFVKIEINSNETVPLDEGPCADCPTPPGLPPVPVIFWLVNDEFNTNWRAGNISGFDPAALDVLLNDNGIKFEAEIIVDSLTTAKGGTLAIVYNTVEGFYYVKYTPPTDQDFVWDGSSEFASFTDSFEYKAEKEINGETVLSKNIATVEITVKNILPVLSDGSQEIQMNTDADFDLATVFELPSVPLENTVYIVDEDGTPGDTPDTYGTLTYGLVEGQIPVADGSIATDSGLIPVTLTMSGDTITYSPLDGYVSPPDTPYKPTTFGYSVMDSSIVDAVETPVELTGALSVTVTNELPAGDSYFGVVQMDSGDSKAVLDFDGFGSATVATDTYSGTEYLSGPLGTYGGTLEYDGEWTYTPDGDLPGYVGDSVDTWSTNPTEYDLDVNPDEQFAVKLWNGQKTYYADGHSEVLSTDYGTGTVSLDITNTLPSGDSYFGVVQMDSGDSKAALDFDGFGGATVASDIYSGTEYISGPLGTYGGNLEYDGSEWTYTPDGDLPGYVGDNVDTWSTNPTEYDLDVNPDEQFTVKLWDGQKTYTFNKETGEMSSSIEAGDYGSGTVSVDLTNTLPTAIGDLGETPMDTVLTKPQVGLIDPVSVEDTTDQTNGHFDTLTIVEDIYAGNFGGTLEYDAGGSKWIYTPDSGHTGGEEFNVKVWDGQYTYEFNKETGQITNKTKVYGDGVVTVTVGEAPPTLPPPSIPEIKVPEIIGCPAVISAAATEVGIPRQSIQLWIGNSLASGVDIQPCSVCSNLLNTAVILRDPDGSRFATLLEIINATAPATMPFTLELSTQIASDFEQRRDEDPRYAHAMEYLDAFAQYVTILDEQLPGLVDDPIAFVMDKYGSSITESENTNIAQYLATRLEAIGR